MFAAASELSRHCERGPSRDDDDDAWVVAGENESVISFTESCPPSFMKSLWISAQHDGMARAIEEYYAAAADGPCGRDNMHAIKAAWEEAETKTQETLTAILKEHKYGSGKWMLFVPAVEVDATWRKIVTALWDGKLGHTAKVSGNTAESNGTHSIFVYVDPFWEVAEVERVLRALREDCGVSDAIKYKADGVSQLGLGVGNEHSIPPSFYAAARNAVTLSVQRPTAPANKWASRTTTIGTAVSADKTSDAEPWARTKPATVNTWVRRETPKPSPKPSPRNTQPTTDKKPKVAPVSAFALLAGAEDGDAEEILEAQAAKRAEAQRKKAAELAEVAESLEARFATLQSKTSRADWGDMEEEEEEEEELEAVAEEVEAAATEDESEEEEATKMMGMGAEAAIADISDAPAAAAPAKAKSSEELEVEKLLASLEAADCAAEADGGEAAGVSKAAAKRAKKKAAAKEAGKEVDILKVEQEGAPAEAQPAAETTVETADAEESVESGAVKSAAEVKKMLAAKVAASKKKKESGAAAAAAEAAKEAKLRAAVDGGKKKKSAKHWQTGPKTREKFSGNNSTGCDAG